MIIIAAVTALASAVAPMVVTLFFFLLLPWFCFFCFRVVVCMSACPYVQHREGETEKGVGVVESE